MQQTTATATTTKRRTLNSFYVKHWKKRSLRLVFRAGAWAVQRLRGMTQQPDPMDRMKRARVVLLPLILQRLGPQPWTIFAVLSVTRLQLHGLRRALILM